MENVNNQRRANLSGADLRNEDLHDAKLSGANLQGANLQGANLRGADLRGADLRRAYLSGANLSGANLRDANLSGANLSGADLYGANLSGANLSGANLSDTNLYGANLSGANLSGANLYGAILRSAGLSRADLKGATGVDPLVAARLSVCPEGDIVGWKSARKADGDNVLVKLLIPADAARSNATGRKCRAARAVVLEIVGAEIAFSRHDARFVYRVGETVEPYNTFDPDRWSECASGIHFFLTREEAEAYGAAGYTSKRATHLRRIDKAATRA